MGFKHQEAHRVYEKSNWHKTENKRQGNSETENCRETEGKGSSEVGEKQF